MPLPLGHAALGLAVHELCPQQDRTPFWKTALSVAFLANLPDVDVVVGLLTHGNGWAFHRGPTHSLLFAFAAAVLACHAWRLWPQIPRIPLLTCFCVTLSHVVSDLFLGDPLASLFWPFEVAWTPGFIDWAGVLESVIFRAYQDAGLVALSLLVVVVRRGWRRRRGSWQTATRPGKAGLSAWPVGDRLAP